ncbi:MAG: hypothetical protein P8Z38_12610, partial [Robiginitalea sp.]
MSGSQGKQKAARLKGLAGNAFSGGIAKDHRPQDGNPELAVAVGSFFKGKSKSLEKLALKRLEELKSCHAQHGRFCIFRWVCQGSRPDSYRERNPELAVAVCSYPLAYPLSGNRITIS